MALANGVCKYLNQQTNLCTIYASRPIFCNVDAFYDRFLKDKMERNSFYQENLQACAKLREKTK